MNINLSFSKFKRTCGNHEHESNINIFQITTSSKCKHIEALNDLIPVPTVWIMENKENSDAKLQKLGS